MIRKLFLSAYLLLTPITLQAAVSLLEDFNTHYWFGPGWGGRDTIMSNITLDGRNVLSVVNVTAVGNYMPIRSNTFPDEDWDNVKMVRAEVMILGPSTTDLKFEMHDHNGTSMQAIILNSVSSGTWQDLAFTGVNVSSNACWLNFTAEPLGANECTYYFNDIRLILNDDTTWYWDDFNRAQKNYTCGGSYALYNADNPGVVSHIASTATTNPGTGYMRWNYNTTNTYGELQLTGLNEDWSAYNTIRADVNLLPDVWTSSTAVPVKFYLWSTPKGGGADTEYRYVPSSGVWHRMYWTLPEFTTYWAVNEAKPGVGWVDLFPGGTFYIDNITVGKINVTGIMKSTDVAAAKPGETVTVTLTYGNTGDMEAPNSYITEVIPFNTYLAADPNSDPGLGSADSVQFYVGSSWTSSYDAACTKVRWKDNAVSPGAVSSVSYKLKIR